MKIVYIAAPFSATTAWGRAENVRAAERLGLLAARAGAMPLIPHTNTQNFDGECVPEFWYAGTLELMRRCDAVLCGGGENTSKGVRQEVVEAERLSIPVLHCHDDVPSLAVLRQWFHDIAKKETTR